jgi:hypothetical protein
MVPVIVPPSARVPAPADWNGRAVKGSGEQIYFVKNGKLHWIPDVSTFLSLKLDFRLVVELQDHELNKYLVGEPLAHVD